MNWLTALAVRCELTSAPAAARGAARQLRRHGYRLAAAPESFFVGATTGPPAKGELDRARGWGQTLGAALVASGPDQPVR